MLLLFKVSGFEPSYPWIYVKTCKPCPLCCAHSTALHICSLKMQ